MSSSTMTKQASDQNLLFDRYRPPCSKAESESIHDYEKVALFIDVLESALECNNYSFSDLSPQVLIDIDTKEIGLAFNQISVLTKAGNYSKAKARKAFQLCKHHNYVFVSNNYVSCMIPGYMSMEISDLNTAAVLGGIFAVAVIKKEPFHFPECPHCAAEAE